MLDSGYSIAVSSHFYSKYQCSCVSMVFVKFILIYCYGITDGSVVCYGYSNMLNYLFEILKSVGRDLLFARS